MDLEIDFDLISYTVEQEQENAAWELWKTLYPSMAKGETNKFISFEEYKNQHYSKKYKFTQKSDEEINTEFNAVVMAYKGR